MENKKNTEHRTYKYFNKQIRHTRVIALRFTMPGFNGVPVYHVVKFFFQGLHKGAIITRAYSIAFQTLLAVLPAVIFFFTLIPYIPIENFKEGVLNVFENILPHSAFLTIQSTLEDMFVRRTGLQLFGLVITLVFSTNAINGIITAFNETYHTEETRTWLQRRIIAAFLVIILVLLLILSIGLVVTGRYLLNRLVFLGVLKTNITYHLLGLGKWIVLFALIYFAIDFLYFFAPSKSSRLKLFSAGSTFASFLAVISTMIFDHFIDNFGQFNKLFGSIGTLIVIMLWIYFNALSLLIGYELNASIKNAHLEGWELPKKKRRQNSTS